MVRHTAVDRILSPAILRISSWRTRRGGKPQPDTSANDPEPRTECLGASTQISDKTAQYPDSDILLRCGEHQAVDSTVDHPDQIKATSGAHALTPEDEIQGTIAGVLDVSSGSPTVPTPTATARSIQRDSNPMLLDDGVWSLHGSTGVPVLDTNRRHAQCVRRLFADDVPQGASHDGGAPPRQPAGEICPVPPPGNQAMPRLSLTPLHLPRYPPKPQPEAAAAGPVLDPAVDNVPHHPAHCTVADAAVATDTQTLQGCYRDSDTTARLQQCPPTPVGAGSPAASKLHGDVDSDSAPRNGCQELVVVKLPGIASGGAMLTELAEMQEADPADMQGAEPAEQQPHAKIVDQGSQINDVDLHGLTAEAEVHRSEDRSLEVEIAGPDRLMLGGGQGSVDLVHRISDKPAVAPAAAAVIAACHLTVPAGSHLSLDSGSPPGEGDSSWKLICFTGEGRYALRSVVSAFDDGNEEHCELSEFDTDGALSDESDDTFRLSGASSGTSDEGSLVVPQVYDGEGMSEVCPCEADLRYSYVVQHDGGYWEGSTVDGEAQSPLVATRSDCSYGANWRTQLEDSSVWLISSTQERGEVCSSEEGAVVAAEEQQEEEAGHRCDDDSECAGGIDAECAAAVQQYIAEQAAAAGVAGADDSGEDVAEPGVVKDVEGSGEDVAEPGVVEDVVCVACHSAAVQGPCAERAVVGVAAEASTDFSAEWTAESAAEEGPEHGSQGIATSDKQEAVEGVVAVPDGADSAAQQPNMPDIPEDARALLSWLLPICGWEAWEELKAHRGRKIPKSGTLLQLPPPTVAPLPGPPPLLSGQQYEELQGNTDVLNVALLADDGSKVLVAATDLYAASPWFQGYIRNRHSMRRSAGMLQGIEPPTCVSPGTLREVITAMYDTSIQLGPHNLGHVFLLANSMQLDSFQSLCEAWAVSSLQQGDCFWAYCVHRLASHLSCTALARCVLHHLILKATTSSATYFRPLSRCLCVDLDPQQQMEVLREGLSAAVGRTWPESFLLLLLLRLDQCSSTLPSTPSTPNTPNTQSSPLPSSSSSTCSPTSCPPASSSTAAQSASSSAHLQSQQSAAPAPSTPHQLDIMALLQQVNYRAIMAAEMPVLHAMASEPDTSIDTRLFVTKRLLQALMLTRCFPPSIRHKEPSAPPHCPHLACSVVVGELPTRPRERDVWQLSGNQFVAVAGGKVAQLDVMAGASGKWGIRFGPARPTDNMRDLGLSSLMLYTISPSGLSYVVLDDFTSVNMRNGQGLCAEDAVSNWIEQQAYVRVEGGAEVLLVGAIAQPCGAAVAGSRKAQAAWRWQPLWAHVLCWVLVVLCLVLLEQCSVCGLSRSW